MKTVVVIMPSMVGGGSERVLTVLMNSLIKKDYRVILALVKKNAVIEYELDQNIIIERNETEENNKVRKVLSEIGFIRSVMKKYKNANCISFIGMYNLYTVIAALGIKVSTIVSERCDPKRTFKNHKKMMNGIREYLYKKATHVVFQTEEARKCFGTLNNAMIIPNPLDEKLPVKSSYVDEKTFVAIGRLEEQKNYRMLMDAMELVYEKFPEAKLSIYGKGTLEEELKAHCGNLKCANQICFEGFTNEVHAKLMNAYAYVSSSDFEGISNAMLEALAIGTPCICTDCPVGGARTFIEDHVNGLLVEVQDVEGLANAILELLEHPQKREEFGNKAKLIREKLDVDVIVGRWEELLV